MKKVKFYMKEHCALCDEAKVYLEMLQTTEKFEIEEINIYEDDALLLEYQVIIPVLQLGNASLSANDIDLETVTQFIKNNN